MDYIYFCPKCRLTFRFPDQTKRLCTDCKCDTIFSGYNASDWYEKPNKERDREKKGIIESALSIQDVGDVSLIESFKESDVVRFKTDSSENNYISYDKNTNLVRINGRYLLKDRLFGFDLVEDGEQTTKGGLGAAVAGGIVGSLAPKLIGRSTGAIVGASIGKRKTTNSCTSLDVIIILQNPQTHDIVENILFHLISYPISRQSVEYMQAKLSGQKIIDFLTKITKEESKEEQPQSTTQKTVSSASEIMEYKNLLDAGIITQEEFNAKKKQLLGL